MTIASLLSLPYTRFAGLSTLLLLATKVDASIQYREVFPNDLSGQSQGQLATSQGWRAGQHDNSIASPPDGQISVSSGSAELSPVNSNPVGSILDTGFAFYSPDQRAGVYIYTQEYSFNSSLLDQVIWDSRNNTGTRTNPSQQVADFTDMHLVLRVGGDFYVSDQAFLHQGNNSAWTTNTADLGALTFGLFDTYINNDTTTLPRRTSNVAQQSGLSLPTGTVDLFGLYIDKNFGTIRIDNFALDLDDAGVVPEATAAVIWLGLSGVAGAGVFARRRRD